jgi:thiol-disulfide isomerase/thioredoxin
MSTHLSTTRGRHGPVLVPLLVLAAIVGAAVLVRGCGSATDAEPSPPGSVTIQASSGGQPLSTGEPVPAFTAPSLDGGTLAWQEFTGRPAVLMVWASWCPHCQAELPVLDAVATDFPDVRVATVVTAVGERPGPSPQQFVDRARVDLPVAVDDSAGTLARGLGVQALPTVQLVGADGRVLHTIYGEIGPDALRAAFQALSTE